MARVVIFDSGVGGLSIYDAVQRRVPGLEIIFLSDNQYYPYGNKNFEQLIPRVKQLMEWVHRSLDPDLIVIACNTASTLVLPTLRESFSTPFVGVVPAIKPAAEQSQSRVIGILATPGTIARPYTDDLIQKFAGGCEVLKIGSSKMVDQAELKLHGEPVNIAILRQELAPVIERPDCDTLVLACTHFPLLNNEIEDIINEEYFDKRRPVKIALVDSSDAIARRVEQLLGKQDAAAKRENTSLTTRDIGDQTQFLNNLLERGLTYRGILTSTETTS